MKRLLVLAFWLLLPAYAKADLITWHFNALTLGIINNNHTLPFPPDDRGGEGISFTGSFTYDSVPTSETITAEAYWLPYDPAYGTAQYSFVGPAYGAEITLFGVHYHWENLTMGLQHLHWSIPTFGVSAGSGFHLGAERPLGIPSLALPLSPSDLPWLFPPPPFSNLVGWGYMTSDSNPNDWVGFIWAPTTVPEPSTFILFGIGFVGLIGCGWRHGKG